MGQEEASTSNRKGKHLTRDERIKIEVLLKKKHSIREIAEELGRHRRTIEREIQRGEVTHLRTDLVEICVYSSERGQAVHDLNATAKGPDIKLGCFHETAEFVREQIVEKKKSPEVVANLLQQRGMPAAVCSKTLYNYIDSEYLPGVTNESLWEKRLRKKKGRKSLHRTPKSHRAWRDSIEKRPEHIESRQEFGHWEIDLIVGGKDTKKPVLLSLCERKTRKQILRKLPDRTQASVLKALNGIERNLGRKAFSDQFLSITADNGTEFLNVEALERSVFGSQKRTKFYYAHPYASWERGSNENGNKMVRRFIRKGSCISTYTRKEIQQAEDWINQYPRKILKFETAEERFALEVAA